MNNQQHCKSQFCTKNSDGTRGKLFSPPDNAKGLAEVWCLDCMNIGRQITFFSSQTAQMIRTVYKSYNNTPLPESVKLILTQFARELVENLGEEL